MAHDQEQTTQEPTYEPPALQTIGSLGDATAVDGGLSVADGTTTV